MPSGPEIIITLKILVSVVTVLFVASLIAIFTKRRTLHGRINTAFFILTMTTVFGFELLLRLGTNVAESFSPEAREALRIHLMFAVPAAVILPLMFISGWKRYKKVHTALGGIFAFLWLGTFITGVFFLPHSG